MSALRLPLDLSSSDRAGGRVVLGGDAAAYLLRVRRATVGDRLVAFDPAAGLEADATIAAAQRGEAVLELGPSRPASVVARRVVTLLQAVGKGDKLDQVVRDATELGATVVSPILAARSVVRRESPAAQARLSRVAVEAARQCSRGDAPRIDPPRPLAEVLGALVADVRIALIVGASATLGQALGPATEGRSVAFAVGPEGGFDEAEQRALVEAGFLPTSLGPFVLRTETVCAAVLGALLART